MSTNNEQTGMSRSTKRLLIAGIALLAVTGAAWAVTTVLDDETGPAADPHAAVMQSLEMDDASMSDDGSVRMSAEEIRTFGVTFATAEVRPLTDQIRTVGIVSFDETRLAAVAPKLGGYIERLYVDFTGQTVRRGQPLLEMYSPELVAAQEELLLAARLEADLPRTSIPGSPAGSSDLVAAARRRLRSWDISDEQIDRILASGRAQRTLVLHAPVGGIVVEKNVLAGQAVQPGEKLYTIADPSQVWVEAELREVDAALVREGSPATVELNALPGEPIEGRVTFIYPTLQSEARTLRARIAIANRDGRIRPGMYATVRVHVIGRPALAVPASAVLDTGERSLVFVDMGDGRLMPHDVTIGRTAGGYAEILSGLEPGQRVVTSAHYLLDSESNLGQVMRSMMTTSGHSGTGSTHTMDKPGGADGHTTGKTMPRMEDPHREHRP